MLLALCVPFLPERLRQPSAPTVWRERIREYLTPLSKTSFLFFALTLVISTSTVFTDLTFISFVMQDERGLDPIEFAVVYGVNSTAILLGSQLVPCLCGFRREQILIVSLVMSVLGSVSVLLSSAVYAPLWVLQVALFVTTFQIGIISPVSMSPALSRISRSTGGAAAMLGGGQFLIGGFLTGSVAALLGSSSITMGATMIVTGAVALMLGLLGVRLDQIDSN